MELRPPPATPPLPPPPSGQRGSDGVEGVGHSSPLQHAVTIITILATKGRLTLSLLSQNGNTFLFCSSPCSTYSHLFLHSFRHPHGLSPKFSIPDLLPLFLSQSSSNLRHPFIVTSCRWPVSCSWYPVISQPLVPCLWRPEC